MIVTRRRRMLLFLLLAMPIWLVHLRDNWG